MLIICRELSLLFGYHTAQVLKAQKSHIFAAHKLVVNHSKFMSHIATPELKCTFISWVLALSQNTHPLYNSNTTSLSKQGVILTPWSKEHGVIVCVTSWIDQMPDREFSMDSSPHFLKWMGENIPFWTHIWWLIFFQKQVVDSIPNKQSPEYQVQMYSSLEN